MATPSEVSICNMALGGVGVAVEIISLTEESVEAQQCNRFYESSRDYVLRRIDWSFARKYVSLNKVLDSPNDDWAYSYRYPTDCLNARRIVTSIRKDPNKAPFEIASDNDGRLIFTDIENAILRYTYRIEDPLKFDDGFIECLSWHIGSKIAIPLSRSPKERDYAYQRYVIALNEGAADARNEAHEDHPPEAEAIRERE